MIMTKYHNKYKGFHSSLSKITAITVVSKKREREISWKNLGNELNKNLLIITQQHKNPTTSKPSDWIHSLIIITHYWKYKAGKEQKRSRFNKSTLIPFGYLEKN